MAQMQRVRVGWTGFQGAPGVSTHYFLDAASHLAGLRVFYNVLAANLPASVRLQIEGTGDIVEATTGVITGAWTSVPPAVVAGSVAGSYQAPAGALIQWSTATISRGRRLKGRTFLVPLGDNSYQDNGGIEAVFRSGFPQTASNLLGTVPNNLLVWQRPRLATAAFTDGRGIPHKAVTHADGMFGLVTGGALSPKTVVLRTRRD